MMKQKMGLYLIVSVRYRVSSYSQILKQHNAITSSKTNNLLYLIDGNKDAS